MISEFLPLRAQLYRSRYHLGVLAGRDCIVGHIPRYLWPRISGRKQLRQSRKLTRDLFFD